MKKYYSIKAILFSIALSFLSMLSFAQVINEDFSTGLPTGWSATANTGSPWDFTNPGSRSITGANFDSNFAIIDSDNQGSGSNQQTYLTTSAFSTLGDNVVTLEFSEQYRVCCGATADIKVSTDGGSTFTTVLSRTSASVGYPNPAVLTTVDISSVAANQASVIIEWEYNGSWDYWWAIDNVTVQSSSVSCVDPSALTESNVTSSSADLDWTENNSSTSWDLEYGPAGFTQGTGTSVNLSSKPYSLTGLSPSTTYDWYVRSDCGGSGTSAFVGSSFTTTFNAPSGVNCVSGGSPSKIFIEEFDNLTNWTGDIGSGATLQNWNVNSGGTGSGGTGPTAAHSGSNYIFVETSGAGIGNSVAIVSPAIDLTAVADEVELSFWFHAVGGNIGTLNIGASTSASGPFTNLFSNTGAYQAAQADPFVNPGIDLTSYLGQTIYIEIEYLTNGSFAGDIAVDLMEIESCLSCALVSGLSASNITTTSADLSWTDPNGASSFEIEYGPAGFTPGTGTTVTTSSNPYSLSGLNSGTTYDWYVSADCGGSQSPVASSSFATNIAAPWSDDFENHSTTTNSNISYLGWSSNPSGTTSSFRWNIDGSGSTPSSSTGPTNGANSGSNYAYVEASSGGTGAIAELTSPSIDVSTLTNPQLSFYYHMFGSATGDLNVDIFDGTTWNNGVFTLSGQQQTSGTDPWIQAVVSLSAYAGGSIQVRFSATRGNSFAGDISLDDVSLEEAPSCPLPSLANTSGITSTSADLNWTDNAGATSWQIFYDTTGTPLSAGNKMVVSTNPYNLSGLSPEHTYDWAVRAICGVGDTSSWSSVVTFTTACAAFTAPYTNDFSTDAINEEPNCWSSYATYEQASANAWVRNISNPAPNSSPNALYLYSWYLYTQGSDTLAAISPQFSDMTAGDKRIVFQTATNNVANSLVVGTLSHPDNPSSFDPLDTITYTTTGTYTQYIIELTTANGYNGTDQYIGFAHGLGSTFTYVIIDDFEYEVIPACANPFSLSASNVTSTSFDLSWTNGGTETAWNIEYGPTGFTQGSGTTLAVTTKPYTISGLTATTDYDVYIQADCGKKVTSPWTGPVTFTTTFNPASGVTCSSGSPSLIFSEEFDNNNAGWTGNIGTSGGNWEIPDDATSTGTGADNAYSGANYMNFEASGGSSGSIVSPAIDLTNAQGEAELSFWMHAYGAAMGDFTLSVGNSSTGPFTTVFNWSGQLQTSGSDPWQNVGVDLSSYLGQTIYIELNMSNYSTFTSDMSIDLFEVTSCVSCPVPTALTLSNITTSSADLAWTAASATAWDIEYGPIGFTQGSGTTLNVSSNPYTITGLSSNTSYDWYIRENCGPGDVSSWVMGPSFTTPCNAFTAPYFSDFESDALDSPPSCWTEYETYTNGFVEVEDFTGTGAPFAGSQALYIYSSSSFTAGTDTLMAISPQFSDLTAGDKRIRFQANSDLVSQLVVGTMSSNDPTGTFTPLYTTSFAVADTYEEITVELTTANGYNGTDEYIGLMHDLGGTFDYIRIDDFTYETIPACNNPSSLAVDTSTQTSVSLTWVNGGTETAWQIEYGPAGFTQGTGSSINASSNPYTVTGLMPATGYDFYLRADCGTDQSPWIGPLSVATGFNAASGVSCTSGTPTVIFSEEFDNNNAGWTGNIGTSGGNWKIPDGSTSSGTGADNAYSGANYMNYEASGGSIGSIVSPAIDLTTAQGEAELSFWMHAYGAAMGDLNIGIGTSASGPFSPVFFHSGQIQTTGSAPWVNVGINLNSYIGQTIYVQFTMSNYSTFTSDMSIDLFEVSTCVNCLPPSNATTSNITANSVDLAWTAASASSWDIEYGPSGFSQGSGTTINVSTNPYTLSGLTAATDYDWYVRENCGPGDESNWIAGASFTTLCDAYSLPYTEDFENGGSIPNCWSQGAGNSENWNFGQGSAATYGPTSGFGGSGYYAWLDDSSPHNTDASIETPQLDLSGSTWPGLEFMLWSEDHSGNERQFILHVDIDAGSGWTNLAKFDVENTGWEQMRLSLNGYQGQTVKLRFLGEEVGTGFQEDIAIDNIVVADGFDCEKPSNLREVYKSDTSAVLLWDANPIANTWYWFQWKQDQSDPWNDVFISNNIGRFDLKGLSPNTSYFWQVRSYCQNGWSEPEWTWFRTFSVPCLEQTNVNVQHIFADMVKITWDAMASSVNYRLRFREQGTTTWGTVRQTHNTFWWEESLNANTTYEYQVKSTCEYGLTSGTQWSSTYTFTTTSTPSPSPSSPAPRMKSAEDAKGLVNKVSVYPNPNNGEFNLSLNLSVDVNYNIEIRDINGRLVRNEVLSGTGQQTILPMNIGNAKGVYLLRVSDGFETSVHKIIVN